MFGSAHSRFSFGLPVAAPGERSDLISSFGGTATILPTDTDLPIFVLQTEADVTSVINSFAAPRRDGT